MTIDEIRRRQNEGISMVEEVELIRTTRPTVGYQLSQLLKRQRKSA
jgi:hypothetical protein